MIGVATILTTIFLSPIAIARDVSYMYSAGECFNLRHMVRHESLRATVTSPAINIQYMSACDCFLRHDGEIMRYAVDVVIAAPSSE